MSEPTKSMRTISSIYLAIIAVTLVLAIAALLQAVQAFRSQDFNGGINFAIIGVSTLALSTYMLFKTRRGMQKITIKIPQVVTTILCQKCGFKTIRDFQRGDYIFKGAEDCPKCNEKMLMASIYREEKKKEDKFKDF